jgi:hypothetical protein
MTATATVTATVTATAPELVRNLRHSLDEVDALIKESHALVATIEKALSPDSESDAAHVAVARLTDVEVKLQRHLGELALTRRSLARALLD